MKKHICILSLLVLSTLLLAQNGISNKFEQLGEALPTPNVYRTGSGAPGENYWQQKADYDISIELDDKQQRIHGEETISYTNNSPHNLEYLWVQLDQNVRAQDSDSHKIKTNKIRSKMSANDIDHMQVNNFDGGFKIEEVKTSDEKDLHYAIVKTMMRVDLPKILKSGEKYEFKIKWWYNINDAFKIGGRSGYEYFEEEDNYMYHIAQFYPRMCVYSDVEGWQNKQFLGRGEFALTFGDFKFSITVPDDFIVAATGELQNMDKVLSKKQIERYNNSKTALEPVMIVTQKEAEKKEKTKSLGKKTWVFSATNVRDYAFAASRKFIWDAMGVKFGNRTVMAMSFYPKEGNPLWERYSTKVVAHTLKWYSHYTFDYPYPVAISTHADFTGMEYPMICFNFGRPEKDGTYSKYIKYGMIGVIIHEVGHNYFPMIVNSDERQWTWMDEGLNTFLQYLTEQQWERDYPSRRGPAHKITKYMKGDKSHISPIMINSESILQFGNNAYAKPATALNILRETIMGRELFDFAFKEYSQRWKFKHPSPADFFRTMEDASAVDLDWFWRGWFYTTDHVDIAISDVKWYKLDSKNPDIENSLAKSKKQSEPINISTIRNRKLIAKTEDEKNKNLRDFYTDYDRHETTKLDREEYKELIESLDTREKELLNEGNNYYEIHFSNIGGIVMPIILQLEFTDGTKQDFYIPAEIWKMNNDKLSKVFITTKEVKQIILDPYLETADTDTENNYYPEKKQISRFKLRKTTERHSENPMQRDIRNKKK